MKKYVQPAMMVQNMETESLMAASTFGLHDEVSTSEQLAKPSFNGGEGNGSGFWADDDDADE